MRLSTLAAVALLLPAAPAVAGGAPPPWWEASGLDLDANGLDDLLDATTHARPVARVLLDYAAAPGRGDVAAVERAGGRVVRAVETVPVLVVDAPASALPALAALPGVVLVEADREIRPALDESRGLVKADVVRKTHRLTGRGVTIAILDTGVDTTHSDFSGRIVASYDATLPETLPRALLGQQVPVVPRDTDGHGTHVAGIAAGPGTRSGGRFAGVAPGAGIANVKVFDGEGESSTANVLTAIDWVLDSRERLRIRVMQMSLGGAATDGTDALSRAIGVAADQGVLTVAAAGNAGPDAGTVGIPGVAPRALTVGAVDKSLRIAEFSARGPTLDGREKPEVVAPGVDVTSTVPAAASNAEFYGAKSGTSMASPHAGGVAALIFEANASLTPALAKWIIVATTRDLDRSPGWDAALGWGLLDADAAVRAARDPRFLGAPEYSEKAADVPFDGPVSELEKLDYQAGKVRRLVPLAAEEALGALAVAAVLVGVVARRRGP